MQGKALSVPEGLKACVCSRLTRDGPGRTMQGPGKGCKYIWTLLSGKCDLLSSEAGMGLIISRYLILLVAPSVLNKYTRMNK